MDPARHRQATELFLEACEREFDGRAGWLAEACAGDAELLHAVEGMLAADSAANGFLENSPLHPSAGREEPVPERIGPFRILGVLGRGGMGVVYEAEQETPRRAVAVKVLRSGVLQRSLVSRFRYEAELLGRLQHPGIAQVYAAGTEAAPDGERPWIAMELVRGAPLHEHAREHALDRDARIDLVARVADAVHHAHQRGIVHRDLKSANVLVDASGEPKVLDFGVARGDGSELHATLATMPGLIVGTLQTMSPEQAEARADIDARTDVYSLGAIAYELLAGRPPLALSGSSLPVALRRLLEEEPLRLGALDRALAGDIEVVVAKALEKDRERRYSSAAALAKDLRCVRRGEPVEARPASTLYLLSKLARRHRGLAAGAGLALIASVAGLVAFALQARSTARAERAASAEARTSAAIDGYLLQDLLAAPDPHVRGRDVRVVDVLQSAAQGAENAFAGEPELLARVRATLARSFLALDELEQAEDSVRAALAFQRAQHGERDAQTLEAEGTLVEILTARQAIDEGLALARSSLARQREEFGADHHTTLTTATNLASLLLARSELEEAAALLEDVIERRTRVLGADHKATLLARENLAAVLLGLGHPERSLSLREESLELRQARYGELDPGTVLARQHLATQRMQHGLLSEPVAAFERILADMREVFGERHHQTTTAMIGLATALGREGQPEQALGLYEAVIEMRTDLLGRDHGLTIGAKLALVEALVRGELLEEAAHLAGECVAECSPSTTGPFLSAVARVLAGECHLAIGDRELAAEHLEAARALLADMEVPAAAHWGARTDAALARARAGS